MTIILDRLVRNCTPKASERIVHELISNVLFHYIEPRHGKHFMQTLWEIGQVVHGRKVMGITHEKTDGRQAPGIT